MWAELSGFPPQKTKHLRTRFGWFPDGSDSRALVASVKLERGAQSRARTEIDEHPTDLRKPPCETSHDSVLLPSW